MRIPVIRNPFTKAKGPDHTPRTRAHNILFLVVAILVGAVCIGSLGISVVATIEKVYFARMLYQMDNIVTLTRQAAVTDHRIIETPGDDMIATLSRLAQVYPTGQLDHQDILTNPWGGATRAQVMGGDLLRLETFLPPQNCRRLITLYSQKDETLNVQRIDIRNDLNTWVSMYIKDHTQPVTEAEILGACGNGPVADISFVVRIK